MSRKIALLIVLFLSTLTAQNCISIACGGSTYYALNSDYQLYSWGTNTNGQLGDGTYISTSTPVQVFLGGNFTGKKIRDYAVGRIHLLILADDYSVFSVGGNYYSQLGDGSTTDSTYLGRVPPTSFLGKKPVILTAGIYSSYAVLDDNQTVISWGGNYYQQLGTGSNQTYSSLLVPVNYTFSGNILKLVASYHVLILTSTGNLYSWGANMYGQLGDGTTQQSSTPVPVNTSFLVGKTVAEISVGSYHSVVLTTDGTVFTWGDNFQGQLGIGTGINSTGIPQQILAQQFSAVFSGMLSTYAISENGNLFVWGTNENDVLSIPALDIAAPQQIDFSLISLKPQVTAISQVSSCDAVSALTSEGVVFVWGTKANLTGGMFNGSLPLITPLPPSSSHSSSSSFITTSLTLLTVSLLLFFKGP